MSGKLLVNGFSISKVFEGSSGTLEFAARWFDLSEIAMFDVVDSVWWGVVKSLAERTDLSVEVQYALVNKRYDRNTFRLLNLITSLPNFLMR